jgi:hypothetical protein
VQARVVTKVSIAAEPAAVFKYLTDLKYHYLWNPQLQSIEPITKLKEGSTYKTTSVVLGVRINAKNEVTKFVKDKELELINNTGMVKYRASFKLSPKPHKTEVACSIVVSSDSHAYAFATPVLKLLARRELQIDLQSLKLAVEHGME